MVTSKTSFSEDDLKLLDDILVNNAASVNFAFMDVDWNERIGMDEVTRIVNEKGDVHFALCKNIYTILSINPKLKEAVLEGLELFDGDVQ